MVRPLTKTLFGALVPLVLMTAAGCEGGDDQASEQEDLQALLRDKDITHMTQGALTTPPPKGGAAGAGGSIGVAGTTGAGGSSFAGTTGTGGFIGSAGTTGAAGAIFDGGMGVGGDTGPGFDGGTAGSTGIPTFGVLGTWTFDDCNSNRTDLFDNGFNGHTAFRSVGVACVPGIDGGAVSISKKEDLVYVPDQPNFTFEGGLTAAGWFSPTSTRQVRTLMRKRDQGTSAFALLLNDTKYQFVINLGGGRAASVTSPQKATANTWTHVAGTYDGTWLRLYVNGAEVAKTKAKGAIPPGPGPLLMGNDGSERRLDGLMDTTFFDNHAATPDAILALNCIRQTPTVVATPAVSATTLANTPATFDIAITNHDTPACTPNQFIFQTEAFFPGISIDPSFEFLPPVASGATAHVAMNVTATDDVDSGTFTIPFFIQGTMASSKSTFVQGSVDFVLMASGCRVSTSKELMIKALSVVDDPMRTTGGGVWTFKHLMEAIAPTPTDAPAMVEKMLQTFGTETTVNSFVMDPRPGFQNEVLASWPRTADGALDLSQAPLQLEAIVDRFDLRDLSKGDAGEGRFVFGFVQNNPPFGIFPFQATLIMEYKLPASTPADVMSWADAWHGLGALTQGTPEYNAALEVITERFAHHGARADHPNGSAINAVRTNEIDFGQNGLWQLREFTLSSAGALVPSTIKLTPDLGFNNTDTLASFINQNEASIIAETHTVPDQFGGAPFATGSIFNDFSTQWNVPGINNLEARFHFGVNTCNGCHSTETGTGFLQISPRFPGSEAGLSGFLSGTSVFDPFAGVVRNFNDLARRRADLQAIECPGNPVPPPPPPSMDGGVTTDGGMATAPGFDGGVKPPSPKGLTPSAASFATPGTTLTKGISRVH